jgi:hypothetical protein
MARHSPAKNGRLRMSYARAAAPRRRPNFSNAFQGFSRVSKLFQRKFQAFSSALNENKDSCTIPADFRFLEGVEPELPDGAIPFGVDGTILP